VSLGESYSFCSALGTPGMDSTYSQVMAAAAAAAAPQPPLAPLCLLSPTPGTCMGTMTCGNAASPNVYFLDDSDNVMGGPYCYTWIFASGGTTGGHTYDSGHVFASMTSCGCPYSTDPTWD
jgi:hypothetical protein